MSMVTMRLAQEAQSTVKNKPSNILIESVDTMLMPKIIDFGVAKTLNQKLTEVTLFTEQVQLVGTPEPHHRSRHL